MRCRELEYRSGAITVFFSIIFLSILLLTMTTVDMIRVEAARADAQRAMNLAAKGVLTEYNYDLASQYGIMGFDKDSADEKFEFYLEQNLTSEDNDFNSNLYNIKVVEDSTVSETVAFSTDEFKYQVLEYMKYRAPLMTLQPFLDKLETVIKSGKTVEKLKDKLESVDEPMKEMSDLYEEFRKLIEGWELTPENTVEWVSGKYVNMWDYVDYDHTKEVSKGDINYNYYIYRINKTRIEGRYSLFTKYNDVFEENYDTYVGLLLNAVDIKLEITKNSFEGASELYKDLKDLREDLVDEIDDLEDDINDLEKDLDDERAEDEPSSSKISNLKDKIKKKENEKKVAEHALLVANDDFEQVKEFRNEIEGYYLAYKSCKESIEGKEFNDFLYDTVISQLMIKSAGSKEGLNSNFATDKEDSKVYWVENGVSVNIYPLESITDNQNIILRKDGVEGGQNYEKNVYIETIGSYTAHYQEIDEDDKSTLSIEEKLISLNGSNSDDLVIVLYEDISDNDIKVLQNFDGSFDAWTSFYQDFNTATNNDSGLINELKEPAIYEYTDAVIEFARLYDSLVTAVFMADSTALDVEDDLFEYLEKNKNAKTVLEDLIKKADLIQIEVDRIQLYLEEHGDSLTQEARVQLEQELLDNERILLQLTGLLDAGQFTITGEEINLSIEEMLPLNITNVNDLLTIEGELGFSKVSESNYSEMYLEWEELSLIAEEKKELYDDSKLEEFTYFSTLDSQKADEIVFTNISEDHTTTKDKINKDVADFELFYTNKLNVGEKCNEAIGNYYNNIQLDKKKPSDYDNANSLLIEENVTTEEKDPTEGEPYDTEPASSAYEKIIEYKDGNSQEFLNIVEQTVGLPTDYPVREKNILNIPNGDLYSNSDLVGEVTTFDASETSGYQPETKSSKLKGGDTKKLKDMLTDFTSFTTTIMTNLGESIRDTIYVNEYIMGNFKTGTSQTKWQMVEKEPDEARKRGVTKDVNLHGDDMITSLSLSEDSSTGAITGTVKSKTTSGKEYETALEFEVEYIIAGNHSDAANIQAMENKLLMLRIPMNLIYLYTHTPERDLALNIATVLTFGFVAFLIPLVQFLILTAWAYAESKFDIRLLLAGWKVPFIKTADSFALTFNIVKVKKVAENAAESAITGIAQIAKDQIDGVINSVELKIEDTITMASDEAKDIVCERLDQVKDEAEGYAVTAADEFTRSFNQFIKESLREMRRQQEQLQDGMIAEIDYSMIEGYSLITEYVGNIQIITEQIERNRDFYQSKSGLTEFNIEMARENIVTNSMVKGEIDIALDKITDIAENYANGVIDDTSGIVSEYIDGQLIELDNAIANVIDEKTDILVSSSSDMIARMDIPVELEGVSDIKSSKSFIQSIAFRYEDYLRFFLIFVDEKSKLARTLDLISINFGLQHGGEKVALENSSVAYGAITELKIDFLFIPLVMQSLDKNRVNDGSYKVELRTVEGY